jgi:hypothetical protein
MWGAMMFRTWLRGKKDEVDLERSAPARFRWSSETWTWIFVGLGVFLRCLEYSDNRQLYRDERDLQENLVGLAFYDFQTPLTKWQLAPPGFLAVERLMIRVPVAFAPAARLVPFLCSIASMFLMRSVARRYVATAAVPVAVGLFAVTDWMLYYSVEIKQYSSDVALTLVALLLAAGLTGSREERSGTMSLRALCILTVFGLIGVWFSFPLALVLAGAGSYLILHAGCRKDWKEALRFLAMSLLWATSFAVCFWVSRSIVSKDDFLPTFWNFAFLPLPPRSFASLKQTFWQLINVFNSPAGLFTPLGVLPSAFIAAGFFLLGGWSLGRRWKGGLFLLTSPIIFALVASALHQYPFHGRLLLFLIPSIYLLVGEGAAVLARPGGPKVAFVLGAFLLAQPLFEVVWHRAIQMRSHGGFDSHGDLRPDVLDYLENLEHAKIREEMKRRGKSQGG